MSDINVDGMRVVDLRAELKSRGLDSKGKKADLQNRLKEDIAAKEGGGAPAAAKPEPEPEQAIMETTADEPAAPAPAPEAATATNDDDAMIKASGARFAAAAAAAAAKAAAGDDGAADGEEGSEASQRKPMTEEEAAARDAALNAMNTRRNSTTDGDRGERRRSRSRDRDRERRGGGRRSRSRDRSRRDRSKSRDRSRRDRSKSRERRRSRSRDRSRRDDDDRKRRRSEEGGSPAPKEKKKRSGRTKPSKYWDVAPPGFENVTPMDYKARMAANEAASAKPPGGPGGPGGGGNKGGFNRPPGMGGPPGMGPPPGMMGMRPPGMGGPPGMGHGPPMPNMPNNQMTRQARRLYVGNIPPGLHDTETAQFFNQKMQEAKMTTTSGNPIISCQVNAEKSFAFLEFRSVDECTACISFDGAEITALATGAKTAIRLRRPKDYVPLPGQAPPQQHKVERPAHVPGVVSMHVPDGPNKIFVGGLPTGDEELGAEQVKEILGQFGELRAFHLVMDKMTNKSKGFCFCEFVDTEVTEVCIQTLNGMDIGGKAWQVQRSNKGGTKMGLPPGGMGMMGGMPGMMRPPGFAPPGMMPPPGMPPGMMPPHGMGPPPGMPPGMMMGGPDRRGGAVNIHNVVSTPVLIMLNMLSREDLMNDEEYEDVMDDIRMECVKAGEVNSVKIPRPSADGSATPGMGKVFVEFADIPAAEAAQANLSGRKFGDKTVVTSFLDLEKYRAEDLGPPLPTF
eukprot:gene6164-13264_t